MTNFLNKKNLSENDHGILFILFSLTGLAAPAIAAGFSALAPTLGTLVPFIGAGGFATAAGAAGSVTGSVAVAASFGGMNLVFYSRSISCWQLNYLSIIKHI